MRNKENPLIIDRADLVAPGQKVTALGITLLFWGALLYLWQPLVSVIAWGLNIHLFYNHMILLGGYRTFLDLLARYLVVIAILGGGLILWARINQWRFRGKERRTGIDATDMAALWEVYGLERGNSDVLRSRRVTVTFVNDSKIRVTADD